MANHILSMDDLLSIKNNLGSFQSQLNDIVENFNIIIDSFSDQEVSQSLYQSGVFGKDVEDKFLKIQKVLNDYLRSMERPDGIIDQTNRFCDEQITRNTSHITH